MNVTEAMEWLLEQSLSVNESYEQEDASPSHTQPNTPIEAFQFFIQRALKNRKERFRPNAKLIQQLKTMGYEDENIVNALRISDNNLKAAVSII